MRRLSKVIVDWQIRKDILTEDKRALYQYAYDLVINQAVNLLLAILIAVVFQSPLPVFVFLVSYIPLRSYCGGYHANTSSACTVVSAMLTCLVCWAVRVTPPAVASVLTPSAFGISGALVFLLAPVQDKHKPLDTSERQRYRFRGRIIWLAEAVIGMLFWILQVKAGLVIAVSHLILSVMLCIGTLKNHCTQK